MMTKRSEKYIEMAEKWITKIFPDAKWYRHDELIINNTVYMWVIDIKYLHMVIGFNDLDYFFSGSYEVLMEEEDGDDLITRDYSNMTFSDMTKAIEADLEKDKNRISAAKYLVETIEKQDREKACIDFVNKIVEDSGV